MLDDSFVFSNNQLITVSAASNYAGTGFGSAGAGVFDLGALAPSSGSGGYGFFGAIGGSTKKLIVTSTVTQVFAGPANAGLSIFLQDSADNVNWFNTDLGDFLLENLSTLQVLGQRLISSDLPRIGGSTNPPMPLQRYIRFFYTVTNGPFTTGAISTVIDVPG